VRIKNDNSGKSVDQSNNPEDVAKRRYHATRCKWSSAGRQCKLTGTLSQDIGGESGGPRAFCAWHFDALQAGHGASNTHEFMAWLEGYSEAFRGYVNEFTSYGVNALWDAAQGNAPLKPKGKPSVPSEDMRPATMEQRGRAIAKALAMLNGKFEP